MTEYTHPSPEENETQKQTRDTKDAIRHREETRSRYQKPQEEEYEHEEKDLSYVDETRLSVTKIVKYIAIALLILLFAVLLFRIFAQREMYNDTFVWTDEAIAAYQDKGDLTVWVQNMSSYHVTTKFDENYNALDEIEFVYYPYSDPNSNIKNEDFEGCFMVGMPMYIEETEQFVITFRINRTAKTELKEHYSLDHEPTGDVYRFSLSDGKTVYTDYDYITFSKNSYYYYRLVFNGVKYENLTGYQDINQSDIIELDLSVYYKYKFNEASPAAVMTVANSYCPITPFDLDDALPAALPDNLKQSPIWEKDE